VDSISADTLSAKLPSGRLDGHQEGRRSPSGTAAARPAPAVPRVGADRLAQALFDGMDKGIDHAVADLARQRAAVSGAGTEKRGCAHCV